MKHTKGPWRLAGTEIWANNKRITMGRGAYDVKDREERKANAHLIAAAPDLLKVCKQAAEYYHESGGQGFICDENDPCIYCLAIAKAEGKE